MGRTKKPQAEFSYQLNDIICGNSRDVLPKIRDNSIDYIFTGPPWDGINMRDQPMINLSALGPHIRDCLKPGGVCSVVLQDKFIDGHKSMSAFKIASAWGEVEGLNLWTDFIFWRGGMPGYWWDKRPRLDHDYVFCYVKGKAPKTWNRMTYLSPKKKPTCVGSVLDYRKQKSRTRVTDKPKGIEWPVPFPDKFVEDMIRMFTKKGDVVLDPFAGMGNTLRIAKYLGRQFLGIELFQDVVDYARGKIWPKGSMNL